MGFLGGILKSVINPATLLQLAAGPAGWASLAAQTIMSSVAQQVISQLGKQLGLPQSVVNLAQQAFTQTSGFSQTSGSLSQTIGNVAKQFGFSPTQEGELLRQGNNIVDQMVNGFLKANRGGSDGDGATSGTESRLVALAKALGKLLDGKMDRIIELGKKLDGAEKQGSISAEMQAVSQEMNQLSQALNNAIKSIGESNSTLARKS